MDIWFVSVDRVEALQEHTGFIPVHCYGHATVPEEGEIGSIGRRRYVVR